MLGSACVVPPAANAPLAPATGVVPADARALRYGATAPEIFDNPQMRDKIRALFGADWTPGGKLAEGARAYFPPTSPLRMIRIGAQDYIAVTGCVPSACGIDRGLLLIGQDGEHLMARLDEGGFSHYYGYGPGMQPTAVPQASIDGAWKAVQNIERG
jgi:hypothetical protein